MPQNLKGSKVQEGKIVHLSEEEERVGKIIVNSAFEVHINLGPGLLEKVYEACFCHELSKRGIKFKRQVDIPIVYDDLVFRKD
jgi:GxxExxY protein